jgi:hypothetical protein
VLFFCNGEKMKVVRLNGLQLNLDDAEECLAKRAADALGIRTVDIVSLTVIKKALDARRNRPPHFVYAVKISLADTVVLQEKMPDGIQIQPFCDDPYLETPLSGTSKSSAGKLPIVHACRRRSAGYASGARAAC